MRKQIARRMNYIETLQEAICKAHGCESGHVESVPIVETFRGKTVWKGTVEVFALTGHATAKRCYAWGHAVRDTGNDVRFVTVLEVPPVVSPLTAVRASILSDYKSQAKK